MNLDARAPHSVSLDVLQALNDKLASRIGLFLPPERLNDLERGLRAAARECGERDVQAWAQRLVSAPLTPSILDTFARHLTIGETYFFRDERSFEILRERILRPLLRERAGKERVLKLWSAACSSGEEAYSLAILLHEIVPRIGDWKISILATDINPDALNKARAGVYPQWSFRALPEVLRTRYFENIGANRWALRDHVKRLVKFETLNLVDDAYPSTATNTHNIDVILCRNVLMYFADAPAQRVVQKLQRCLREGGYLLTSANEGPRLSYAPLVTLHWDGAIVYRKTDKPVEQSVAPPSTPARTQVAARASVKIDKPKTEVAAPRESEKENKENAESAARRLADVGNLDEALRVCDAAFQADKFNARLPYLRAQILLASGSFASEVLAQAAIALRGALYLDPDFLMAHLTAGNVARAQGKNREAARHFANARRLAQAMKSDASVPDGDGLHAAQLLELLETLS